MCGLVFRGNARKWSCWSKGVFYGIRSSHHVGYNLNMQPWITTVSLIDNDRIRRSLKLRWTSLCMSDVGNCGAKPLQLCACDRFTTWRTWLLCTFFSGGQQGEGTALTSQAKCIPGLIMFMHFAAACEDCWFFRFAWTFEESHACTLCISSFWSQATSIRVMPKIQPAYFAKQHPAAHGMLLHICLLMSFQIVVMFGFCMVLLTLHPVEAVPVVESTLTNSMLFSFSALYTLIRNCKLPAVSTHFDVKLLWSCVLPFVNLLDMLLVFFLPFFFHDFETIFFPNPPCIICIFGTFGTFVSCCSHIVLSCHFHRLCRTRLRRADKAVDATVPAQAWNDNA